MENLWFIRDTPVEENPEIIIRTFYETEDSNKSISYDNLKSVVFKEMSNGMDIRQITIPKNLFEMCERTFNELGRMHYNELKNK